MQNGEIVDTQISSSSSMDEAHAASRGRLHLNATSGKAGAWSAGTNDNSQWLQVDLRNNNIRVSGVATQGRNGRYAQWVTKYKLQYSNKGVNFQYYKEPGQTALKVCTKSIQLPMPLFMFIVHSSLGFFYRTIALTTLESVLSMDKINPNILASTIWINDTERTYLRA